MIQQVLLKLPRCWNILPWLQNNAICELSIDQRILIWFSNSIMMTLEQILQLIYFFLSNLEFSNKLQLFGKIYTIFMQFSITKKDSKSNYNKISTEKTFQKFHLVFIKSYRLLMKMIICTLISVGVVYYILAASLKLCV